MLATMAKFGFPEDYIKREEQVMKSMTVEEHKAITDKYIVPDRMYYVVVGDAATQMKQLEKAGLGKPVIVNSKMLDANSNPGLSQAVKP
jgi:zinc protease